MKYKPVNKIVREVLEKENSKVSKKVLAFLDKDRVLITLDIDKKFYIEPLGKYRVPGYVYRYLIKKCGKIFDAAYVPGFVPEKLKNKNV